MRGKNLPHNSGYFKVVGFSPDGNRKYFHRVAAFLKRVVQEYALANIGYKRGIGMVDFPMAYGEEQNQALMFTAMRNSINSNAILPECPFNHKHRIQRSEKKRLDYWIYLKQKGADIVYLVEYKHQVIDLKKQWYRHDNSFKGIAYLLSLWGEDVSKLNKIPRPEIRDNLSCVGKGKSCDVLKISLLVVPIRQFAEHINIGRSAFIHRVDEIANIFRAGTNTVTWKAVWWLSDDGKKYIDEERFRYLGAYFFAWIKEYPKS